ncbi:uncharacterized protein LOC128956879 [Oppia nitens]|uniref:uncharacterized protein LOC128956879 n=1 Tax=Oppia nitens TaxID=1686743 RepID=UPI0023DBA82F|nr:uncharacterized protein LOC128956879 [Oppia nitens]
MDINNNDDTADDQTPLLQPLPSLPPLENPGAVGIPDHRLPQQQQQHRHNRRHTIETDRYSRPVAAAPVARSRSHYDRTVAANAGGGGGQPSQLSMSSLYGHPGPGHPLYPIIGELFMPDIRDPLNDNDYRRLRQQLASYGFQLDDSIIVGTGRYGHVFTGRYGRNIRTRLMASENRYLIDDDNVEESRPFAAKYIRLALDARDDQRLAVYMEKQIMKYVGKHPNIVGLRMAINMGSRVLVNVQYDTHWESFYSYQHTLLIMDLADRETLRQFIARGVQPSRQQQRRQLRRPKSRVPPVVHEYTVDTCIKFMRDLLGAVRYLHRKHVAHCDLHDANVLVFSQLNHPTGGGGCGVPYVAKLTDFGYAQCLDLGATAADGRRYLSVDEFDMYRFTDRRMLGLMFWHPMIDVFVVDRQSGTGGSVGGGGSSSSDGLPNELKVWRKLADKLIRSVDTDIEQLYDKYLFVIESIGSDGGSRVGHGDDDDGQLDLLQ